MNKDPLRELKSGGNAEDKKDEPVLLELSEKKPEAPVASVEQSISKDVQTAPMTENIGIQKEAEDQDKAQE